MKNIKRKKPSPKDFNGTIEYVDWLDDVNLDLENCILKNNTKTKLDKILNFNLKDILNAYKYEL